MSATLRTLPVTTGALASSSRSDLDERRAASQRLAAEGSSIVVRLLPHFLLRLESLEERSDFAEAIRGAWLRLRCPCREESLDAVFLSKSELPRRQAHLVPL